MHPDEMRESFGFSLNLSNPEAERVVLSIALAHPKAVDEILLSEADFHSVKNCSLWKAIKELSGKGQDIDVISLCEHLERNGVDVVPADVVGIRSLPSTLSRLDYYCGLVRNATRERGLLELSNEIAEIVNTPIISTDEKMGKVESLVIEKQQDVSTAPQQINHALKGVVNLIDERFHSKGLAGLPTGIQSLDKRINGLSNSNLILLAARPAMGKTCLALNIATHIVTTLEKPVLVFSLEMTEAELVERCVSNVGGIDYGAIRSGNLKDDQWTALSAGIQSLKDKPLYIDDTPGLALDQLRSKARSLHRKVNLSLIVVDYLQLVRNSGRSKVEEVGEISRSLKELAKELDLPILCLSQLNRSCDTRAGEHRPHLSDLRDSGSLEQDADIVMFIYRDEIYHESSEQKGMAEIITRKFRAGQIGTDFVEAHLNYQRFSQPIGGGYND